MSDQQLIDLYSGRILELAAEIPLCEPLDNPMVQIKKRAPLCGSTIAVEFDIEAGQIVRFGQNVKACALGQAAASVVASNIIGCTFEQMQSARAQMQDMLANDGPPPDAPFSELKVLLPARSFKNRHASIMLALDAVVEGWDTFRAPQTA